MPEGHTLHRMAATFRRAMGGAVVAASSPQGRFADGAALLDGTRMVVADAHGKHLLLGFADPGAAHDGGDAAGAVAPLEPAAVPRWLHVHLGLYGRFPVEQGEAPPPQGAGRLLLTAHGPRGPAWALLRGPTACEVLDPDGAARLRSRLGPDPLREDADPQTFYARVAASRAPVGALLMHQDVIAGLGNIYRAEVLYRAGLDPYAPGRTVDPDRLPLVWEDSRRLLREGVRLGRIVTTEPEHRTGPGPEGRPLDHYVYGRAGLPCRLCGTPVATAVVEGRNLFWCPQCQAPGAAPPFQLPWLSSPRTR
ncbi:Fpg/Nei family DNA glycosylase [Quadrisphaera sp. DSM 44207]|uniref:Fpg/Nei family DNA glycosylase n=1 Tax=Quadrisphaera sp. DSM 44207 TaxID=1881057 RepID=UPI00087F653D|nr:zinc finger domain-containing protein [Quadrisphaera sp. DSM 44207]SDQ06098.1 endonuclease-8/formamidopyrimidine-DNA glycosylase [Quadrisphaera sp. DSM 44207]